MPTYETLNLEHKDGLACLTINRPKSANTLNRKLMQEFNEAWIFWKPIVTPESCC